MGGHYEKGMYDQLMDVMAKLDALEAEHKKDRKEIRTITSEVVSLRKENDALRDRVGADVRATYRNEPGAGRPIFRRTPFLRMKRDTMRSSPKGTGRAKAQDTSTPGRMKSGS